MDLILAAPANSPIVVGWRRHDLARRRRHLQASAVPAMTSPLAEKLVWDNETPMAPVAQNGIFSSNETGTASFSGVAAARFFSEIEVAVRHRWRRPADAPGLPQAHHSPAAQTTHRWRHRHDLLREDGRGCSSSKTGSASTIRAEMPTILDLSASKVKRSVTFTGVFDVSAYNQIALFAARVF
jgi:hypothetical protein